MVETVEVATAVAAAIEVDERATMSIEIAHANHPPSPKSDCSLTARHRIITYLHHLFISSLKSTCPVCCSSFFIKKCYFLYRRASIHPLNMKIWYLIILHWLVHIYILFGKTAAGSTIGNRPRENWNRHFNGGYDADDDRTKNGCVYVCESFSSCFCHETTCAFCWQ